MDIYIREISYIPTEYKTFYDIVDEPTLTYKRFVKILFKTLFHKMKPLKHLFALDIQ